MLGQRHLNVEGQEDHNNEHQMVMNTIVLKYSAVPAAVIDEFEYYYRLLF